MSFFRVRRGFTLIELLTVITIVCILLTMSRPIYKHAVIRAEEAALRDNLWSLRDALDQFYADQHRYPNTLGELTINGYLRSIPKDPVTNSSETWIVEYLDDEGIWDVHSGSRLAALDGTPYSFW